MTLPFLLNSSLVLAACLAFYKVLLRRETFYRANRYLLLLCLLLSFALPLLPVPQRFSFRQSAVNTMSNVLPAAHRENQNSRASSAAADYNILSAALPPAQEPKESALNKNNSPAPASAIRTISLGQLLNGLFLLYWFGVIVLAVSLLFQLAVLLLKIRLNPVIADGRFRIVELSGDQAPCSFGRYIFINPAKYDWPTYNQILAHEKIHIHQRHSLDILLAELVVIFQWFNPFAWLFRREVENNLEFLTDDQVMRRDPANKKGYQLSLLRVSAPQVPLRVTTNYNQSILKKRIAMMNKKRSNLQSSWKYLFLLPLLVGLACLLNEPIAMSQTGKTVRETKNEQAGPAETHTETTENRVVHELRQPATGENEMIAKPPAPVTGTSIGQMKPEGYWFAVIKGDEVHIRFSDEKIENDSDWESGHRNSGTDFKLSELSEIPKGQPGSFHITREAGRMDFTGRFDGNTGMGTYTFTPDQGYVDYMNRELEGSLNEDEQMGFFIVNVTKAYLQMLHKQGYGKVDKNDVLPLRALQVDEAFIQSIRNSGFRDISLKNLIPFKALGINGAYIKEIRDAGFQDILSDKLIAFKAQGIDRAYIDQVRQMRGTGAAGDDEDDIIAFKALNISQEFINSYKPVGYNAIPNDQLVAFKSLGVTPEYIKSWQEAGYAHLDPERLVGLKSQGITPAYLKSFENAGYSKIDPEQAVAFKALGITPEYINSFRTMGYDHIDSDQFPALKSQNITPQFIKSFEEAGFKNIKIEEIVAVKAMGVTPDYIREMRKKGFNYDRIEKYITLKSLD